MRALGVLAFAVFSAACGQGKSGPLATEDSSNAPTSDRGGSSPPRQASAAPLSDRGGSCPPRQAAQDAFNDCGHAKDGVECREHGGEWKVFARQTGGPTSSCVCPVPDEGCPCTKSSDCLSACVVEHISSLTCKESGGVCGRAGLGCHCILDRNGKAGAMCAD